MSDKLTPVHCGCGGEVWAFMTLYPENTERPYICQCRNCFTRTGGYPTEAEAITAWNRAMGSAEKSSTVERTAKVIEHDASVTDTDGYKYHRSEYLCGACKKKVLGGDEYCSHCGCRLDWNEDIPMEYFESGGR